MARWPGPRRCGFELIPGSPPGLAHITGFPLNVQLIAVASLASYPQGILAQLEGKAFIAGEPKGVTLHVPV